MPRTTAPSTNPRILSGYTPYPNYCRERGPASTTESRRQLLLNDPHARDVQPEQVTCVRCSKTVRLQKGKKYHLAHWLDHRWRCDHTAVDPLPTTAFNRQTIPEQCKTSVLKVEPNNSFACNDRERNPPRTIHRQRGVYPWTDEHKSLSFEPLSSCSSLSSNRGLGSTSTTITTMTASLLPVPSDTNSINALASDPLIADFAPKRVKCALCLSWIDIGGKYPGQNDPDVYAWRQHRNSCVTKNSATAERLTWSNTLPRAPSSPRFRYHCCEPRSEESHHESTSCDINSFPSSSLRHILHHSPSTYASTAVAPHSTWGDRSAGSCGPKRMSPPLSCGTSISNNTMTPPFISPRSISPPPLLSFSTSTSTVTSVASTPAPSPRPSGRVICTEGRMSGSRPSTGTNARGPSLFPDSRHLPALPALHGLERPTSLGSLSRFALANYYERDERVERERGHEAGVTPRRGSGPSATSPGLDVQMRRSESPSPAASSLHSHLHVHAHASTSSGMRPPPFLERTHLSLPIPERYWRFESVN